jgi:hypothetical protein
MNIEPKRIPISAGSGSPVPIDYTRQDVADYGLYPRIEILLSDGTSANDITYKIKLDSDGYINGIDVNPDPAFSYKVNITR